MAHRFSLRRPKLFVVLALALGAVFSWSIPLGVGLLPWTRNSSYVEILTMRQEAGQRAFGFILAAVSVAWCLRRRIVQARGWRTFGLAWACVWIGGGAFMFFYLLVASPAGVLVFLVDGPLEGIVALVFTVLVGGPLLGILFSQMLLPIAMPLAWLSVLLLRWGSGGTIAPKTAPA